MPRVKKHQRSLKDVRYVRGPMTPTFRAGAISALRRIVKNHQYETIDGVEVDAQTANAILTVHDNLSPDNQRKMAGMTITQMQRVAYQILKKQGAT